MKFKSNQEHNYTNWTNFKIAIEVAALLQFLNIIRILVIENKFFILDGIIWAFLFITFILQEYINKAYFVEKVEKLKLPKKRKKIIMICIILEIIILIIVSIAICNWGKIIL